MSRPTVIILFNCMGIDSLSCTSVFYHLVTKNIAEQKRDASPVTDLHSVVNFVLHCVEKSSKLSFFPFTLELAIEAGM